MKNTKRMGLLLGAVFTVSIWVAGCAGQKSEEWVAGGGPEQESQRQESMEQGAESEKADAVPGSEGAVVKEAGRSSEPEGSAAKEVGQPTESVQQEAENGFGNLREFEALALDGSTFTQDDFADKDITVINFWALSCGPCLAEMPDLAEFGKALPDNIQLMTVCLDGSGYEEYVEYVMEQTGFEGTTLLAGNGDLLSFCQELQYTPTTVLVDKEGNTVGYAIIGTRENLAESYTFCINSALADMGKDEISIGTEAGSDTDTE